MTTHTYVKEKCDEHVIRRERVFVREKNIKWHILALLGQVSPLSCRYEASSVQTLSNKVTVRAKATITFKLLLFSKFWGVTMPEFGRGVTANGDLEEC